MKRFDDAALGATSARTDGETDAKVGAKTAASAPTAPRTAPRAPLQRPMFLASRRTPGLPAFLTDHGVAHLGVLPTAANRLADRAAIVGELDALIATLEGEAVPLDPDALGNAEACSRLAAVDAIVVGGGDPYYLLDRLRTSGLAQAIAATPPSRLVYVGISAGAIVAGPSLLPHLEVSPFEPPPGFDPAGLGLADVVVLPHRDRPGRVARIAAAEARFAGRFRLQPLGDDEVWTQRAGGMTERA